ncbi:glycoside hydrolase family 2 protein [Paenibacillus sp. YIM B09110]|uniref:glycoside hydrolase family 2 protein n=1 Tax=Paenibacillus sp. YIM B09110 TaxID=3126102 RepID=UPI00301B77CC
MIRLFETNEIRETRELEGLWDFAVIDQASNEKSNYKYRLPVPGCWEMHPELLTYRGRGMYRRTIVTQKQTALRFVFKGVSHSAKVFFDNVEIGVHYNAYTAFSVLAEKVEPGDHELRIEVDNSFHEDSSLHVPNDYYTYGGLIRPVVMEEIGEAWLDHIRCTPFRENDMWGAEISVTVHSLHSSSPQVSLRGELAGRVIELGAGNVRQDEPLVLTTRHMFPEAESWSEDSPRLYQLKTWLHLDHKPEAVDDLIERVGFRVVTTTDGKIQVNGSNVVLKGFNRHEDHPMAGSALPLQLMLKDLELMQDMGANCVRTSHYPNDERFLDLCDELGMLVWEENHARGLSLDQMRHPRFIEQCEAVNREMVVQHGNHPSIVTWGILNECSSDTEEGRVHYKRQLEQIRELDSSRPLTFASDKRTRELCFDLADIVSFNLYPQWYTEEDPGELIDGLREWAKTAGGDGKPIIMSEFGGDGFYGYRSPSRVKGTEERQADIIERNLSAYTSRDYISGMLIWQFCDCRVTEEGPWPMWRAMTKNSKGIVDEYRRPKLAYSVVQHYFKGGR